MQSNVTTQKKATTQSPSTATPRGRAVLGAVVFGLLAASGLAAPVAASAAGNSPVAIDDAWHLLSWEGRVIPVSELVQNDTDADGGVLKAVSISSSTAAGGTATVIGDGTNDVLYYNGPSATFTGTDRFTYRAQDAQGNLSNLATVTITVQGGVPIDDIYTAATGQALTVTTVQGPSANDVTNTSLGYFSEVVPTSPIDASTMHGSLVMNANGKGGFGYTSAPGFVGSVKFSYKLKDGATLSKDAATVTINVQAAAPIPPVPTPKVSSIEITDAPAGVSGAHSKITVWTGSWNGIHAGAVVLAYIDGKLLSQRGLTLADGTASIPFTVPAGSGSHLLTVLSGGASHTVPLQVIGTKLP